MKILFFTSYSIKGPSSRYRIYNYIKIYSQNSIKCGISYFWGEFYFKRIIFEKNKYLKLIYLSFYYPFCLMQRYFNLVRAPFYDVIHIERDFCPGFPPIGEKIISKVLKKKIVYEFDDAVYLTSKPKGKIEKVLKISSAIIAGNDILEDYAKAFCLKTIMIPTSIDVEKYSECKQNTKKANDAIIIGWIGTSSTMKYLDIVKTAIIKLSKVYKIELNIICSQDLNWDNNVTINNIRWELDSYIYELCKFDIGIMPLYDTEWEKGKCGFKLIQYMGVGIPVIASPVGVNNKLILNDLNGYLAYTDEDWYRSIVKLIENKSLREEMGKYGKAQVEKEYSITVNSTKLIKLFNEVI